MLGSAQAWSAQHNRIGEWMQIDLGSIMTVSQLVTQGRINLGQWVTTFKVKYSTDGATFTPLAPTFTGNADSSTRVSTVLPMAIVARYVQLADPDPPVEFRYRPAAHGTQAAAPEPE